MLLGHQLLLSALSSRIFSFISLQALSSLCEHGVADLFGQLRRITHLLTGISQSYARKVQHSTHLLLEFYLCFVRLVQFSLL